MQKARRQHTKCLRPLVGVWFQGLFTPLFRVLFTFPSRYSFTIGLSGVFSLTRWCWQFQREFHRLPPTQDTATNFNLPVRDYHPLRLTFPSHSSLSYVRYCSPTTPKQPKLLGFGLFRVRSPLLAESLLFSLPPGT